MAVMGYTWAQQINNEDAAAPQQRYYAALGELNKLLLARGKAQKTPTCEAANLIEGGGEDETGIVEEVPRLSYRLNYPYFAFRQAFKKYGNWKLKNLKNIESGFYKGEFLYDSRNMNDSIYFTVYISSETRNITDICVVFSN